MWPARVSKWPTPGGSRRPGVLPTPRGRPSRAAGGARAVMARAYGVDALSPDSWATALEMYTAEEYGPAVDRLSAMLVDSV